MVVTPLVAIMKDQVCSVNACITACSEKVQIWSKRGLSVAAITRDSPSSVKEGVMAGCYQLVFFTPELLIKKAQWRELLSDAYAARICAFVVDEAHCVKKW